MTAIAVQHFTGSMVPDLQTTKGFLKGTFAHAKTQLAGSPVFNHAKDTALNSAHNVTHRISNSRFMQNKVGKFAAVAGANFGLTLGVKAVFGAAMVGNPATIALIGGAVLARGGVEFAKLAWASSVSGEALLTRENALQIMHKSTFGLGKTVKLGNAYAALKATDGTFGQKLINVAKQIRLSDSTATIFTSIFGRHQGSPLKRLKTIAQQMDWSNIAGLTGTAAAITYLNDGLEAVGIDKVDIANYAKSALSTTGYVLSELFGVGTAHATQAAAQQLASIQTPAVQIPKDIKVSALDAPATPDGSMPSSNIGSSQFHADLRDVYDNKELNRGMAIRAMNGDAKELYLLAGQAYNGHSGFGAPNRELAVRLWLYAAEAGNQDAINGLEGLKDIPEYKQAITNMSFASAPEATIETPAPAFATPQPTIEAEKLVPQTPAPQPAAVEAAPPIPVHEPYTVKPGDTLSKITLRFYDDVTNGKEAYARALEIAKYNNIDINAPIHTGQVINLPLDQPTELAQAHAVSNGEPIGSCNVDIELTDTELKIGTTCNVDDETLLYGGQSLHVENANMIFTYEGKEPTTAMAFLGTHMDDVYAKLANTSPDAQMAMFGGELQKPEPQPVQVARAPVDKIEVVKRGDTLTKIFQRAFNMNGADAYASAKKYIAATGIDPLKIRIGQAFSTPKLRAFA